MNYIRKSAASVSVNDLRKMNEAGGLQHHINAGDPQQVVMDGHWAYQFHSGGLSAHCVQVTELENLSNASEIPPGLSFNLLFEGRVDFALGGQHHTLGAEPLRLPECSSIILAKQDIMTRYLRRGMRVHKINVFAQRSWLESRCSSAQESEQLEKIFQHHGVVRHWQASVRLVKMARSFMQRLPRDNKLASRLRLEHMTIEMLSACLHELDQQLPSILPHDTVPCERPSRYPDLKQRIDDNLQHYKSLQDIAASLGFSTSTLQRRFKSAYGTTVIDYIRQRRLEIARSALTLRGMSIGEAAYLAGYNHPSNFVTAFKKRFAVTPAALVKSHRKGG